MRSSLKLGLQTLIFMYIAEKVFDLNIYILGEVQIPQKTKNLA